MAMRKTETEPGTEAGTEFRLTRLGVQDLEEIVAIEKSCYANPWSRESFTSELTQLSYSRLWGLRPVDATDAGGTSAGPLAAFAVVWVIAGEGHLANLATAPAQRRRGHARTLLRAALDDARHRDAQFMLLEVRAGNEAAIALYREFGFCDYGRRPKYYEDGEDALLMRLEFSAP